MSELKDTIRAYFEKHARPPVRLWSAIVGRDDGVVDVPNRPKYIYVKMPDGSEAQAFNGGAPVSATSVVLVGYDDYNPEFFQVLTQRAMYGVAGGAAPNATVGLHAPSHRADGFDPLWLDGELMLPALILAQSTPDMTVRLPEIFYLDASANLTRAAAENSADLTAYQPATVGAGVWVCITRSKAGVATYTAGSEFPVDLTPEWATFFAVAPREHFIYGDVLVRYDATGITQQFIDGRRRGYWVPNNVTTYAATRVGEILIGNASGNFDVGLPVVDDFGRITVDDLGRILIS